MYAIGEIALVVIGILLALAINNANEDRLTREKEQVYLQGLQRDFAASKSKLVELLAVNQQNYQGVKQIANYIAKGERPTSEKVFSELLFQAFAYDIAFNPNNSLLDEMINSGSLKDLSSADLRRQLTNWNSFLVDIAKQEDDLRKQRENLLDLFRTDEYAIRTVLDLAGVSQDIMKIETQADVRTNMQVLESATFENHLLIFILTSILTETEHYQPLMEELDVILSTLTQEIEKEN